MSAKNVDLYSNVDYLYSGVIWPDIITDPDQPYRPEVTDPHLRRAAAIADGLSAWGNCMLGAQLPAGFGMGMVRLREIGEVSTGTPEGFAAAYEAWMAEHDALKERPTNPEEASE